MITLFPSQGDFCATAFVLIYVLRADAGSEERIVLQIKHLTAVRFGDTSIADEHDVVSQTGGYCWRT
jgi:hypothetical protein